MSKEEAIAKYHQNPILVGSDGFVRLVDLMGDDDRICDAARNSYQKGTTQVRDNAGLIDYLFYNKHTSPVEMCEITLHVKVPMAIWRQWVRHRTASINEYSTRYSEAIDDIAIPMPGQWRLQSQSNKQGSDGNLYNTNPEMADALTELYSNAASISQQAYQQACAAGVAREQARDILPLSNYTEAYWKIDLHNLFHFLRLRIDSHAQQEIREFGNAIAEIVKLWVPLAYQAWEDNIKDTLSLSSKEIELLAELIDQEKLAKFLSTEDSTQRKLLFDKLNISSQTKRISFYRKVSKLQRG